MGETGHAHIIFFIQEFFIEPRVTKPAVLTALTGQIHAQMPEPKAHTWGPCGFQLGCMIFAVCYSFCAAYTPRCVYTRTQTQCSFWAEASLLRPRTFLNHVEWPHCFALFWRALVLDVLAGLSNPGLTDGRVSGLNSTQRAFFSFEWKVGCVGLNVGVLAATFHEGATGWAWDMRLLISCDLKLWRSMVEQ